MDKYGVVQEATDDEFCRRCGSALQNRASTNAVLCPKCGTFTYEDSSADSKTRRA